MKTLILGALLTAAGMSLLGADSLTRIGFNSTPDQIDPKEFEKAPFNITDPGAWINWRWMDKPWRVVDGQTNYVPRAEGWYYCYGKVNQVVDDRLLVTLSYYRPKSTNAEAVNIDDVTVMLKNYPGRPIDGDRLPAFVGKLVGTTEYRTVLGAINTVRVFDCGVPCGPVALPNRPSVKAARKNLP